MEKAVHWVLQTRGEPRAKWQDQIRFTVEREAQNTLQRWRANSDGRVNWEYRLVRRAVTEEAVA